MRFCVPSVGAWCLEYDKLYRSTAGGSFAGGVAFLSIGQTGTDMAGISHCGDLRSNHVYGLYQANYPYGN